VAGLDIWLPEQCLLPQFRSLLYILTVDERKTESKIFDQNVFDEEQVKHAQLKKSLECSRMISYHVHELKVKKRSTQISDGAGVELLYLPSSFLLKANINEQAQSTQMSGDT